MPILTIRDGTLDLLERVRTRKKAWPRVIQLAVEAAGYKPVERMGIIHINAAEEARQFLDLLSQNLDPPQDTFFAELTPGLSVHGGTGMVGVVFIEGK
jgi:fatty acid-binding protein DegV